MRNILLSILLGISIISFGQSDTIKLSLPDVNCGIMLVAQGFELINNNIKSDFVLREYTSKNKLEKISMTIYLELNSNNFKSSYDYAKYQWDFLKHKGFNLSDTSFIENQGIILNQYTIKEYNKQVINQKIAHAFIVKDNMCVDVYLTKTGFTKTDQEFINNLFNSIKIIDPYIKTSFEYFQDGSFLFLKENYASSAKLLEKSLEIERVNRQLPKNLFYILIDNLGMSNGILMNFKKAIDIFEYGLTIDSKYPMFYYNLACAYSELNDIDKAINNLDKAFQYKDNMLEGEKMPNPKEDSSFEKILNNDKFKKALKNLN